MVERGTQVIGVWGAMHSESHGFVASVEWNCDTGNEVRIQWNDGSNHHTLMDEIQENYLESNSIGVYVNPFTNELI